jgi:tight adherence protein B
MTPLLISLMAFAGVASLVGVLAFVFRDQTPRAQTRLDVLVNKRKREQEQAAQILRQEAFSGDKKSLLEALTPSFLTPHKLFEQADCHIKPSTLFGIGLILAAVGVTVTLMVPSIPWLLAPVNGLVMLCLPMLWLWNKRRTRLKKFAAQLSDALELVARALRAGHSLGAGMHVVAEEMPAPIADEFNRVYEEQNLGIAMEDSLRSMCERVPNLDLKFFVTSVCIQRQTGGDLAEILDKIGYVVRERYRILGQVKALTAEGRLSGVVLIALPFALFGFMLHLKPDYVESLWTTERGRLWSAMAIVAQIVGALVIRKIVNIKV